MKREGVATSIPFIGVSDPGVCEGVKSQRERRFDAPGVSSTFGSVKSSLISRGVSAPQPGVNPPSRADSYKLKS